MLNIVSPLDGYVSPLGVKRNGASPPPPGPTGDGILLEDGVSFLLAENGDYLVQEAA